MASPADAWVMRWMCIAAMLLTLTMAPAAAALPPGDPIPTEYVPLPALCSDGTIALDGECGGMGIECGPAQLACKVVACATGTACDNDVLPHDLGVPGTPTCPRAIHMNDPAAFPAAVLGYARACAGLSN